MNVLVFIQRRSLLFYYANRSQPLLCAIPVTVMNDLEILNEQELHSLLAHYIPPKDPKSQTQIILLLGDDICFSSWLAPGKEEETKKTMIDTVPFANIESVTVPLDQHQLYIITNQDLYRKIGQALETYHCTIIGAYPWVISKYANILKEGGVFDSEVAKKIFEVQPHIKDYGFPYLSMLSPAASEGQHKSEPTKKTLPKGWVIFICFAVIYVLIMLFFFVRK
jgi:hypothetical protein